MRPTTVFRRLLRLQAANITRVELRCDSLVVFVDVEMRRRSFICGRCRRRRLTGGYDSRVRLWRHLDLGAFEVYLRGRQRRFHCPHCRSIVTELMPWADPGSAFTRDFEDLVGFFAQQTNQTVVSRVMHIAWPTVGNIIRRTVVRHRRPLTYRRFVRIGVDEISYRRHHKYLTLIADHDTGAIVYGGEGKSGDTLVYFVSQLRYRDTIQLVSMDMSAAYIAKVKLMLPHATIAFDPFHVVKLANHAVDEVRRAEVRRLEGRAEAGAVKHTRWVLLKAPQNLDRTERERLAVLGRVNRPIYRAYLLKESLRSIYRYVLPSATARLDAWLAWATRSRLRPFIRLARTLKQYRDGILAAIEHGLSNGRLEGINNKVRLISHRAFGFHSAPALLALVYLCCSGIELSVPADKRPGHDPFLLADEDRPPI